MYIPEYKIVLRKLLSLVDFERYTGPRGPRVKFDLRRMESLLEMLGNPHSQVPTIHVAGTKGKGSTVAMVASVLSQQGFRTGTFISPHLHSFRERISVNGEAISQNEFVELFEHIWPHTRLLAEESAVGTITLFEMLTAMAFLHFDQVGADFQVVEVGLGGRLDSTNLVSPNVTAITSISLDHTAVLGDTIGEIAMEKAGIIKSETPVVIGIQHPDALNVIRGTANRMKAPIVEVGNDLHCDQVKSDLQGQSFTVRSRLCEYKLVTPLLGEHQLENAAVSIGVIEQLVSQGFNISKHAIDKGFRNVVWPARLEVLDKCPLIVVDGAHNLDSIQRLSNSLPLYFNYERVVLLIGGSDDKPFKEMIQKLATLNPIVIATASRHPRAINPAEIIQLFNDQGISGESTGNVNDGLQIARAKAKHKDLIIATGSLFIAAEVRELVNQLEHETYDEFFNNEN